MSIVGLLLAAGSARRFGAQKLLVQVADGVSVAATADAHLIAALPRSLGVVRPADQELSRQLTSVGLDVVENGRSVYGMGTSIAAGVAATPEADGWVIALGDMPWVRPETIRAVADALVRGSSISAPCIDGIRGHPVGFSAKWRDELLALNDDFGARNLITALNLDLIPTDDPGVRQDIDHPADLTAQ